MPACAAYILACVCHLHTECPIHPAAPHAYAVAAANTLSSHVGSKHAVLCVLQLSDPISVTADWYQLGGTSLKAIGLSAAIKQHFNLSGPSGNLILLTTIRDMAACVQQQLPSSSKLPKEPVDSSIPVNSWPDELRPVSSGQSQMYVLCNEGSNRHYNETSLYGFAGNLCITTLHRAADAITERHGKLL